MSGGGRGRGLTVRLTVDVLKTRIQQGDGIHKPPFSKTGVIMLTARTIVTSTGFTGLWRGTTASLARNIPGVALYMTTLTQLRTIMSTSPYFIKAGPAVQNRSSVLPSISSQGNLIAGAITRVGVGFLLNPFSVLKARFEVCNPTTPHTTLLNIRSLQSNLHAYNSLTGAFITIVRSGPSELLRGFMTSSLRDAPYAGLFVVFYEAIKHETCMLSLSLT